jgi:hypothetical protein
MICLSKRERGLRHLPLDPFRWCYTGSGKKGSGLKAQHSRSQTMTWETPEFVEVKMDAEINSYQDDFGGDRDTGV